LATSPVNYTDNGGGRYLQVNVVLTPGIPPFDRDEIYHLTNGPGTPDISVRFRQLVRLANGTINIETYAI
jgi:hypothetical protein